MKILHMISGGELGGAKTHVHTLLSGLRKTEDVLLVCFIEGSFAEEAKALGIPTLVLDTSVPGAVRRLTRLIREQGFELLHCHGSRANLIGSLLKHKVGDVVEIETPGGKVTLEIRAIQMYSAGKDE